MQFFKFITVVLSGLFVAMPQVSGVSHTQVERAGGNVDVIQINVDQLKDLKLFLKNDQQQALTSFKGLSKSLAACQQLQFAMNAGMYHADYSPVGLYIEQGKQQRALNTDTGYGNFFMQPNGVLAWNDRHATIQTTQKWGSDAFKANYATQSGPMLVIDGEVNPLFLPDSTSLKIRNGVGVKDNVLYFVISRHKVNFYTFAQIFKQDLGLEQALYLDGSISSLYFPPLRRHDARYALGPMLGLVDAQACK
ncbi:uncharacterized protein YigE (DUF2233 family) [Acinetobacter calcoaceticus]|uniref:Uncharacterized protein YigE (DUF2233 family) n=1 Tax=Acinetobacter calcoaceticus TaxID=471 RepID=A0A4R1XX32_ACICA|nr:uncharacterized protein YigE (DUF2233 family) [Acinetobacter calcoaceticus]